jgi:hypothetical protein
VISRLEREFFAPARRSFGDQPWLRAHAAGAKLEFVEAIDSAFDAVPITPNATRPRKQEVAAVRWSCASLSSSAGW